MSDIYATRGVAAEKAGRHICLPYNRRISPLSGQDQYSYYGAFRIPEILSKPEYPLRPQRFLGPALVLGIHP